MQRSRSRTEVVFSKRVGIGSLRVGDPFLTYGSKVISLHSFFPRNPCSRGFPYFPSLDRGHIYRKFQFISIVRPRFNWVWKLRFHASFFRHLGILDWSWRTLFDSSPGLCPNSSFSSLTSQDQSIVPTLQCQKDNFHTERSHPIPLSHDLFKAFHSPSRDKAFSYEISIQLSWLKAIANRIERLEVKLSPFFFLL